MQSHLIAAGLLGLALAGCTQTGSPVPTSGTAAAGVTPSTFVLPEGGGCSGNVARFRAVLKNDLETGHVGKAVHDRANGDLDRAGSACSAGREVEANAIVASTKGRFGYP